MHLQTISDFTHQVGNWSDVTVQLWTATPETQTLTGKRQLHLLTTKRQICWKACGKLWPSIAVLCLSGKTKVQHRVEEEKITCPAKTSRASTKAASRSFRLLAGSLWCYLTPARRCQCCSPRKPSVRPRRLFPSLGLSVQQEPPFQRRCLRPFVWMFRTITTGWALSPHTETHCRFSVCRLVTSRSAHVREAKPQHDVSLWLYPVRTLWIYPAPEVDLNINVTRTRHRK